MDGDILFAHWQLLLADRAIAVAFVAFLLGAAADSPLPVGKIPAFAAGIAAIVLCVPPGNGKLRRIARLVGLQRRRVADVVVRHQVSRALRVASNDPTSGHRQGQGKQQRWRAHHSRQRVNVATLSPWGLQLRCEPNTERVVALAGRLSLVGLIHRRYRNVRTVAAVRVVRCAVGSVGWGH